MKGIRGCCFCSNRVGDRRSKIGDRVRPSNAELPTRKSEDRGHRSQVRGQHAVAIFQAPPTSNLPLRTRRPRRSGRKARREEPSFPAAPDISGAGAVKQIARRTRSRFTRISPSRAARSRHRRSRSTPRSWPRTAAPKKPKPKRARSSSTICCRKKKRCSMDCRTTEGENHELTRMETKRRQES